MIILLLSLLACGEPPTAARPAPQPEPAPTAEASPWIQRTDLEMDAALRSSCEASVADGKPVLLEFSAAWCVDCRKLHDLAADDEVIAEMAQFHHLTVDVGKWDRHKGLIDAFGVSALAWWSVLQPEDCSAPPPGWKRLKEGSFEPASTGSGARTAEGVTAWLQDARGT